MLHVQILHAMTQSKETMSPVSVTAIYCFESAFKILQNAVLLESVNFIKAEVTFIYFA